MLLMGFFFMHYIWDFIKCQHEVVQDNQTTVESYQETFGIRASYNDKLKHILGHNTNLWFIPVFPKLRINYMERFYSYQEQRRQPMFIEETFEEDKRFEPYWMK